MSNGEKPGNRVLWLIADRPAVFKYKSKVDCIALNLVIVKRARG